MTTLAFTPLGAAAPAIVPAPWTGAELPWLRAYGRTVALVIDDRLGSDADLTDETELRTRVCDPLNAEFRFAPECAAGGPLARNGDWFESVLARVRAEADRLAAVFLDLNFEGDSGFRKSTGARFLGPLTAALHERFGGRAPPVFVLTATPEDGALSAELASRGLHAGQLAKVGTDVPDQLAAALYERGWLSDPTFGAYDAASRAALAGLRGYAVRRPRLEVPGEKYTVPAPLLFTAGSGEGKTYTAQLAAKWLLQVHPPLVANARDGLRSGEVAALTLSTFADRNQGAQVALFGRGPQDKSEHRDASGLAALGAVQRAAGGALVLDEVGNSAPAVQQMLLGFVENGLAEPEFPSNALTAQARGPFDVLCVFTAQPRHVEEGRIVHDLLRRYERGGRIDLPALADRPGDLGPLVFEALLARWPANRPRPGALDDVLLPEAQQVLAREVSEHRLSASRAVDLFRDAPAGQPVGLPFLNQKLRPAARPVPLAPPVLAPAPLAPLAPTEAALELVERLRARPADFPKDKDSLCGKGEAVSEAAAALMLAYLEAAIRATGPRRSWADVYRLAFDTTENVPTNRALTALCRFVSLNRTAALAAFARSEELLELAVAASKNGRAKEVKEWLSELAKEQPQRDRLAALGWGPGDNPDNPV